jgi:hypothetical protein
VAGVAGNPHVAGNPFGFTERERRIDPNPGHWNDPTSAGAARRRSTRKTVTSPARSRPR